MGINTRLCPFRQRSARLFRLRQSAGRACLDGALSRRGLDGGAQPEIYLRHARHADNRRACPGDRRAGRLSRHHPRRRPGGGDRAAAGLPLGRRSSVDRRSGLSSNPQFRRHDAETAGGRGRVLRSPCRRRHCGADQAQHQGRVHRIAPPPTRSRCRTSRPSPGGARRRGYRHDGQYRATPLFFPPARPRRRHLDPCGDEISGRHSDVLLGTVSANAAC